jgi:hypothetical protein
MSRSVLYVSSQSLGHLHSFVHVHVHEQLQLFLQASSPFFTFLRPNIAFFPFSAP